MATSTNIAAVVSYPSKHPESGEALKFDMDYYISTHMPMIERTWGPYGMQSWSIIQFPDPCPMSGQTPPYLVQTTCYFDTVANLRTAFEKGASTTVPDVEKFSNVFPAVWVGETGKSHVLSGGVAEGVAQA
ncbi:Nn.00g117350.m01.CDS01 [Neocucurbitaria sp. VM-36]